MEKAYLIENYTQIIMYHKTNASHNFEHIVQRVKALTFEGFFHFSSKSSFAFSKNSFTEMTKNVIISKNVH